MNKKLLDEIKAELEKISPYPWKIAAENGDWFVVDKDYNSLNEEHDLMFSVQAPQRLSTLISYTESIENKLEVAVKALEYYGDRDNWSCPLKHVLQDGFMKTNSDGDGNYQDPRDMPVLKDKVFFKKANKALQQIKERGEDG